MSQTACACRYRRRNLYLIDEINEFVDKSFVSIGLINELFPWELGIVWQALIGGTMVTCLEFITGVIVNIWLKLGVWDYSGLPLNILGQVCLPFYFAWVGLSVVAIVFDDYLRYWFFGEEKPHYKIV